jgi:hypothetical protein
MKKLILSFLAAALLLSTVPSYAWNRGGNGYNGSYGHRGGYNNNYRGGYNNNWIAPAIGGLIIGGIVGSALASPYYVIQFINTGSTRRIEISNRSIIIT